MRYETVVVGVPDGTGAACAAPFVPTFDDLRVAADVRRRRARRVRPHRRGPLRTAPGEHGRAALAEPAYAIVSTADMAALTPPGSAATVSYTAAAQALDAPARRAPRAAGRLQVVETGRPDGGALPLPALGPARRGADPSPTRSAPGMPARATIPSTLRVNGRDDVGGHGAPARAGRRRQHRHPRWSCAPTRRTWRASSSRTTSRSSSSTGPTSRGCSPRPPATPPADCGRGSCSSTVRRQPGVTVAVDPAEPPPGAAHRGAGAARAVELPDLAESWAWAHAQVVDRGHGVGLAELLAAEQHAEPLAAASARAGCGRTRRTCRCVVPAFEVGRLSGLGLPIPTRGRRGAARRPGGAAARPAAIDLPVLYHWEFSTGGAGDFESLALRLHPSPAPEGLGVRPLDVSGLGFGIPDLGNAPLGGALRPIERDPARPAAAGVRRRAAGGARPAVRTRRRRQRRPGRRAARSTAAGRRRNRRCAAPPPWLRTVNLDPRLRAAAGLGSMVVQDQQEHLMAAAWEQLGPRRHGDAASCASPCSPAPCSGGSTPGSPRSTPTRCSPSPARRWRGWRCRRRTVRPGATVTTLAHQLSATRTPSTIVSGAFRKAVRPQGPLARRAPDVAPGGPTVPVARPTMRFVDAIATRGQVIFLAGPAADMVTPAIVTAQFDGLIIPSLPERDRAEHRPPRGVRRAARLLRAGGRRAAADRDPAAHWSPPRSTASAPATGSGAHGGTGRAAAGGRAGRSGRHADRAAHPTDAAAELPGRSFGRPMYEPLRDLDPQFLLPGLRSRARRQRRAARQRRRRSSRRTWPGSTTR